jgi:hypothetical protein
MRGRRLYRRRTPTNRPVKAIGSRSRQLSFELAGIAAVAGIEAMRRHLKTLGSPEAEVMLRRLTGLRRSFRATLYRKLIKLWRDLRT